MAVEAKEQLAKRIAPAIEAAMKSPNSPQQADFAGGVLVIEKMQDGLVARIGEAEYPGIEWGFNAYRLASMLYEQMSKPESKFGVVDAKLLM